MKKQKLGRGYHFDDEIANKISKYGIFLDRYDVKNAAAQTRDDAKEVVKLISDVLPDLNSIRAHFTGQAKLWNGILALFENRKDFYQDIIDNNKIRKSQSTQARQK